MVSRLVIGGSGALLVAVLPLSHSHGSELLVAADEAEVFGDLDYKKERNAYFAALVQLGLVGELLVAIGFDQGGLVRLSALLLVALLVSLEQLGGHFDLELRSLVLLFLVLLVSDELHDGDFGLLLFAHVLDHVADLHLQRVDLALDVDLLDVRLAAGVALALQTLQTFLRLSRVPSCT